MGIRNVTVNICNYMNGSMQSLILDVFLDDVKKYGNVVHRCPYTVRMSDTVEYILIE